MNKYNQMLFKKMVVELEQFKAELLKKEPKEIYDAAYETVVKENIISIMEEHNLDENVAKELVELNQVLNFLYRGWLKTEDSFMEELTNSINKDAAEVFKYMQENF